MQKPAHEIYSFDEFRLNLTRGSLFRGDVELKLRPKSFEVLRHFTENSGRLIGKDELIEAVWHETAVTDDSLVQCLKDIRRALNDDQQTIIKTVPRRGYIFESEVSSNGAAVYTEETSRVRLVIEESEETSGSSDEISGQGQITTGRKSLIDAIKRHKIVTAVASLSVVAVIILTGIVFYRPVLAWWLKPPSIAVLPIVNGTSDANLDYISDGLTDSIITSLNQVNEFGKIPRLLVTAQNAVFIFKGKEFDPLKAGRDLGVDTIVTSKMFDQDGLRNFKIEMINVANGSIRWKNQYSYSIGQPNDLLETQNKIPGDIAEHLPIRLSPGDRLNLTRRYTQNPEVHDLYLKGRAEFRRVTPSGLKKSIEIYQQAIELDPNFALAYWAMGNSIVSQGSIDERPDKEADEQAIELFRKALKIDSNLSVANLAMRLIEAQTGDWKAIEAVGPMHPAYGSYLMARGRVDEQLETEKRRLLINPYGPFLNFTHCNTLLGARRYDEAIAQCRKTLNLDPTDNRAYFGPESPWVHLLLANIYVEKGAFADAIAEAKIAIDLAEDSEAMLAVLGYIYARAGKRVEAIKILDLLHERMGRGEYVPPLNIAWIYGSLGDNDQAFFWLDKAYEERETKLTGIKVYPPFDPLRSDPRFPEFVRRLGLPN